MRRNRTLFKNPGPRLPSPVAPTNVLCKTCGKETAAVRCKPCTREFEKWLAAEAPSGPAEYTPTYTFDDWADDE